MALPLLGAAGARGASSAPLSESVPFYGRHQAGVTTPSQARLHFAAFDVTVEDQE